MLYFECPSCKANCETTEAFAGKTVHCPHCGKQITVPIDPTAVSTTPLPPKPKPATSSATTPVATPSQPAPAATPSAAPASAASAEGGGNPLRNLILIVVGIGIVVFLVIWLMPGDGATSPLGAIKIELFADKAPITTANFLKYVDDKHYDGTIFHRVIGDFMIQGGGFDPGLNPKSSKFPAIPNESSPLLPNKRGTISMARTPEPNSATDQFFINVEDNSSRLPGGPGAGYAVFGTVIEGMDTVDKIRAVEVRDRGGHQNVPVKDVVIKSIRRAEPNGKNPVVVMEVSRG